MRGLARRMAKNWKEFEVENTCFSQNATFIHEFLTSMKSDTRTYSYNNVVCTDR